MAHSLFSIPTVFSLCHLILLAVPALSSGMTLLTPLDNQLPPVARVNQSYSWPISNYTFGGCDDALDYSLSELPAWIAFDPATKTFHGTPKDSDEGDFDITLTARGCETSSSSWCRIFVTSSSPPILNNPVAMQFRNANPSLSSVFVLNSNSVLSRALPAVRIPPSWSFSIGFQGDTCTGADDIFYAVLQADGTELPSWMRYNPHQLTIEGVTPHEDSIPNPFCLALVLHASDIKGSTALTQSFTICVASREVSMTKAALPTINVTASSSFDIPLNSAADFSGMMVDGKALQPEDLTDLFVTTNEYPWISYDQKTRHLTGIAPANVNIHPVLLARLTTTFNQTIETNVSIALEPSFFISEVLPSIVLGSDRHVKIDCKPFISDSEHISEANLSASYDLKEAETVLQYNSQSNTLTGVIPGDFSAQYINVTLMAYSATTHSTSHSSFSITFPPSDFKNEDIGRSHGPISKKAHFKLVLGLSIAFGIIGGVVALGVLLALFRRCARVEDTALGGKAGQQCWSDKDKKWYGIDKSYEDIEKSPKCVAPATKQEPYGGLGLRRVLERSYSSSPGSKLQSSGVMSKREFVTRIRDTVRNVSDNISGRRRPLNLNRPVIGKPILITSVPGPVDPARNPFADSAPNGFLSRSSSSINSIPQRRSDFLGPRHPGNVHFVDDGGPRDSMISISNDAAEAIVQTASRASVRSAMSIASDMHAPSARPRLVPFTSATRVPVPNVSASPPCSADSSIDNSQRIVSQTALVDSSDKGSGDELNLGIHYVRSLGADHEVGTAPSTLTVSTNVRSSFSSLESSHHGDEHVGREISKMVARVGERFKFRLAVVSPSPVSTGPIRRLRARLMSGAGLPRFLHADLNGRKNAGAVEFYGVPSTGDTGELDIGVFESAVCVGRVHLEVIGR